MLGKPPPVWVYCTLLWYSLADIAKITGDQAIVLGAHKRAFGLPEDGIGIGGTGHYWATVVNKVASIRFTSAGSRESLGSQHWVRWLYSWV